MVKFIKKVLLFFALIAIVDIACGFGFNYLRSHAKGGDTQKNYYISEQCSDDVLILGSSRAARHYDPKVLEESLGMTCYNCGEPGCGIITAYARLGMIETRKKTKLVIYEVSPGFDYFKTDDYSKYLGRVKQYADKPNVKRLFVELGDEFESLRLISNMYKNNSSIVHNILDNLVNSGWYHGFKPLYGVLSTDVVAPKYNSNDKNELDSLKYSYLERMVVDLLKDSCAICFMVSPRFITEEVALLYEAEYEPVLNLCHKYNIPFLNYTYMKRISNKSEYFQDYVHLNKKGAYIYTKAICSELKKIINSGAIEESESGEQL